MKIIFCKNCRFHKNLNKYKHTGELGFIKKLIVAKSTLVKAGLLVVAAEEYLGGLDNQEQTDFCISWRPDELRDKMI